MPLSKHAKNVYFKYLRCETKKLLFYVDTAKPIGLTDNDQLQKNIDYCL